MVRVELSVLVPAPLSEVFSYASDWRRWEEWYEGVSGFRAITEVTRGNGAQYAYKAHIGPLRATVVTEITEFVENGGWTGVARKGMRHATHWRFEAVGDQTRFVHAVEGKVPIPVLGGLIAAVVLRPQWQRIVEGSLANLRRRFESLETTHPPTRTNAGA
jgi:hypothetical protein